MSSWWNATVFDVAMRQEQADRIRLLERLRAAVDAAEFAVHYQPIVTLDDARPVAVEALAALQLSGLPATALTLEITEGVLVRSGAHAAQALLHRAQGYHFARPIPAGDLTELLAEDANIQVRPIPADEHSDAGLGVSVK